MLRDLISISIDVSTLAAINGVDIGDIAKINGIEVSVSGGGYDRGVFNIGNDRSVGHTVNVIEYITISTTSDSLDFGDLTEDTHGAAASSNGSNSRGVFIAGVDTGVLTDKIDYVTISTPSNATYFGDALKNTRSNPGESNAENDRAIRSAGTDGVNSWKDIGFITISSLGNATYFGDMTQNRRSHGACSNGTNERIVFLGGSTSASSTSCNIMEYITVNSIGDATDFGDLTGARIGPRGSSNRTDERGLIAGGSYGDTYNFYNIIEKITINSLGNSSDFGDLVAVNSNFAPMYNMVRSVFATGRTGSSSYTNRMDYVTTATDSNAADFGDASVIAGFGSGFSDA
jgi:hypothetical protein